LISSTIITAVFRSGSPSGEAGPVTENNAPILTGGAAKTAPAIKKLKHNTKTILKIFFDIPTSIIQYKKTVLNYGYLTDTSVPDCAYFLILLMICKSQLKRHVKQKFSASDGDRKFFINLMTRR